MDTNPSLCEPGVRCWRGMGAPKLGKKEQAERTRASILDAAIKLFSRKGYAATSTQDLADAIGMTTGVLYWHFEDKEDLLVAVLRELEQRLTAELMDERGALTDDTDVGTTLARLIARTARVIEKNQDLMLLVGVIGVEATDTNPRVEKAL